MENMMESVSLPPSRDKANVLNGFANGWSTLQPTTLTKRELTEDDWHALWSRAPELEVSAHDVEKEMAEEQLELSNARMYARIENGQRSTLRRLV
jgi:hypothetical protein